MARANGQRGVTLVELIVAAAIGSIVLGAVAQALVVSSRHFARADTLAQMQEQADVALRFMRGDIRMAGHWGALRRAKGVAGRALPGDPNPGALALPRRCAPAFTTDVARGLELVTGPSIWGCRVASAPGNHALAVRYASADSSAAQRNRLQLEGDVGSATLSTAAMAPSGAQPGAAIRDLAVRGYYLAPSSSVFPEQPVLRRLTLNALTSGPLYIDEEITQGIEALRLAAHADLDGDGAADAMLAPGHPALARADALGVPVTDVLAVDVAIVVRSATAQWRDAGAQAFDLLGESVTFPDDGHLRIAVSQTVLVRNAGWPR